MNTCKGMKIYFYVSLDVIYRVLTSGSAVIYVISIFVMIYFCILFIYRTFGYEGCMWNFTNWQIYLSYIIIMFLIYIYIYIYIYV